MLGNMIVAMRMWRVIDGWLSHPYIKGVMRAAGDAQPQHESAIFEEGNYRDVTRPKTIRLLSPPSLETCDIFTMEPAFGRLPFGSRRTLLFHEPVAGLPGRQLRRAPFFLNRFAEPKSIVRSFTLRRNDP